MDDDRLYQSILLGDKDEAAVAVTAALAKGAEPERLLSEQMIAAMSEVGRLYEEQEYFIPEMMISARAMKKALSILKPRLSTGQAAPLGRFVIGTVKGDLHDIGKNLVAIMLEGVGFEVIDLGVDVSPQKFAAAVQKHHPDILGMSALLTTTMPYLERSIEAIQFAGVSLNLGIMIGGAPVSQGYAERIGADLYAPEAASAARLARTYLITKKGGTSPAQGT